MTGSAYRFTEKEGPPAGGPSQQIRSAGRYFGVTVSGTTTCVVPGVTSDVIPATDL